MKETVYNIIWADDEYATLKNDMLIRKFFDKKHIIVLKYVSTSDELKLALERFYDKVDAVIVDGNFSRQGEVSNDGDNLDITGLVHTLSFIETFNQRREIPFFLYTGKKTKIQELCKQFKILSYFEDTNDRIFQKGEIEGLCNAIVESVDHIHSVVNQVNKNYSKILSLTECIDWNSEKYSEHARELLYEFLLNEARDKQYEKAESMFANLRIIIEQIADNCKNLNIVPEAIDKTKNPYSLNYFARYWSYNNREYGEKLDYIPYDEEIMPSALSSIVKPVIDILQDGSHGKQDLNLHVSDYVASTQTPFLFRISLHFVLNMIYWFSEVRKLEIPSYYKRNPYMLIHKEYNKKNDKNEYRYKDFYFDNRCIPADSAIGKDIQIISKDKKRIIEYIIIED